jgi:hypothetical protein
MTSAQRIGTPLPVGSSIIPGTLRARLEELRAQGTVLTLSQAVGVIVPLAVEIAERHERGEVFYVHPTSVGVGSDGAWHLSPDLAHRPPTLPRDKACMAPEERAGRPGNARASVFSIGAMLYELVTGQCVGPGMRRPTEIDPALPPTLELILSKALVADPAHRPDDLNALAQAVHHLAPTGSIAPPPADESHLDHAGELDVDVSMSMMPPARPHTAKPAAPVASSPRSANAAPPSNAGSALSPYDMVVSQRLPPKRQDDHTAELSLLKARLESDPRPRYVVVKDGMDHGPFNAVELLQQIASNTFKEGDFLRDSLSKQERMIKDWEEFAPFAEHARLHRDIKAEKEAIDRVVVQERKSTAGKAVIGVAVIGVLIAAGVAWFVVQRGVRHERVAVQTDSVSNLEIDAGLNVAKKAAGGKRGGVVGSSGGFPQLGGGMSCEAAQAAYVEEWNLSQGTGKGRPDLTAGQYGAVLNNGSYLGGCNVPDTMSVSICVAVQNGRAVGVSVSTSPSNPGVAGCVAGRVRGLSFPSHPRLDVTRTTFSAQ